MDTKIVFEGQTEEGKKFIIRYPQESDAQAMTDYINALSKERTFIRFQGEIITLKEETEFLQNIMNAIENKRGVYLLAACEGEQIGISGIDMQDRVYDHVGIFGISISKKHRGSGIGKTLMDNVLKEAGRYIPSLRIIILSVFGNNPVAQEMYKKFGFTEYGRLPGGILHNNQYVDHIYMYKKIK